MKILRLFPQRARITALVFAVPMLITAGLPARRATGMNLVDALRAE